MTGIFDWVRGATVVITAEDDTGQRSEVGSGFFVAPGWVVSCAHVVATALHPQVRWQGHDLEPDRIDVEPKAAGEDGQFAFPDAAVLRVPIPSPEPPCVPISLGRPVPGTPVWAYGITLIRTGRPESFASRLEVADDEPGRYRLQNGQIGRGMSGGPVLDLSTSGVCGMTKARQEEQSDLGGWVIPIADALAIVDDPIEDENQRYHVDSIDNLRRSQMLLGELPATVVDLLEGHPAAIKALVRYEKSLKVVPPPTLADGLLCEWAVRRLFDLTLDDLIVAIQMMMRNRLDKEIALPIFDLVAACLPVRDDPVWWVDGDAVLGLRKEADQTHPRIVRICTDEPLTVEVLMRRAFDPGQWVVSPAGGPSKAVAGADGHLLVDTWDDIFAEILRLSGATHQEWEQKANALEVARQRFRKQNRFFQVRVDAKPDGALLTALAGQLSGVRFLISKRLLTLPAGLDHVVLDLRPPIDPTGEYAALAGRANVLTG